jgi:plasmid replication initiation protein
MATIWDADILIWAASQIVEARDAGLRTSRLMAATPMKSSGSSAAAQLARLSAPQGRARPAPVDDDRPRSASRRGPSAPLLVDQRMEGAHRPERRPDGIELIVPDWFYQAVLDDALVLTIDRAYFD